jgi:hypothetical protein
LLSKMRWYYEIMKTRLRKSIPKPIKEAVWRKMYGTDVEGQCSVCRQNTISAFRFHCGHILAVSKTGTNEIDNLLPICDICNLSMGNEDLGTFKTCCEKTLNILNSKPLQTKDLEDDSSQCKIDRLQKSHKIDIGIQKDAIDILTKEKAQLMKLLRQERKRKSFKQKKAQNYFNSCRYCEQACRKLVCNRAECQNKRNRKNQARHRQKHVKKTITPF